MTTEKPRVALLVTCLVDQLMPEVGVATVRLLQRAGYEVDFPAEQTCCGQPFFNSGFRKEAIRLAKRTIGIFEGHEAVVLPSGSCTSMIRVEYPHLLQEWPRWHYAAQRLAAKTFELSEFLVKEASWPQSAEDLELKEVATVTYHDSCHMCRLLQLREEPRQLLRATGHTVAEMSESDKCCGFGGLFSVRMPEVSNAMTADKVRRAVETTGTVESTTKTTVVATADPGCLMQMKGIVENETVRIKHIATLLEEATR